jgi:hypothetical protein
MKEWDQQTLKSAADPLGPGQSRRPADSALQDVLAPYAGGQRPGANAPRRRSPRPKRRGRLDREVLVKLGKGLKDCFAEVQRQEVPERFKVLLRQL